MPQFRSKGKGKNRTVYPVDPRKRYVHGRVYHVKKVYSSKAKASKDNRSLADRMMEGTKGSPWRVARAFRTREEANTHKAELAASSSRKDQSFKVVKGNDPTYPYELHYAKKSELKK